MHSKEQTLTLRKKYLGPSTYGNYTYMGIYGDFWSSTEYRVVTLPGTGHWVAIIQKLSGTAPISSTALLFVV